GMRLFVRTSAEPERLTASIRQAVTGVDPRIPVFNVQMMDEYVSQATEQSRLNMALFAAFGGLALVLASLGIYGVLSYVVGRRTQEIGVRLALGATRTDVMRLIVGQGMALTASGIAIGLAAAWVLTRVVSTLLYGISPHDPMTFIAITTVLTAVAILASYLPGLRATRVDPLEALRAE